MGIFSKKSITGVEIDACEIRVVELAGPAGAPKLLRVGKKALPADVVKEGRVLRPDLLAASLEAMWQESGIGTRNVILGVNNQDVLVRFAYFPLVPQDRIDNLIRFQAQEFLPIPVADVELDYVVVGEEKAGDSVQMKVLLVAARRNMITDFLTAFDGAGLKVLDIDMSTLAIARLLPAESSKSACAAINIGYEQTNILILSSSQPHLARSLITGQRSAAGEKERRGNLYRWLANGTLPAEEMDSVFSSIAGETRNSISYFQSQKPDVTVDKIYLCGCGSRIPNMPQKLEEYTGIPVITLQPFGRLNTTTAKSPVDINEAMDFSISISLALRGLEV